jgi:hypothetical protein
MRRPVSPDPSVDDQLLGILLAGMWGQTRADCSAAARLKLELRPSGIHAVVRPKPEGDPES